MSEPENFQWPEIDTSNAEYATQEDVSYVMQWIQENVERFGVESMTEDGLPVADFPEVEGEAVPGHKLHRVTIGADRLLRQYPDFYHHWQVEQKIEFQWQPAHDKLPPNNPLGEITHVPDTAAVLITRSPDHKQPEECIIMQRKLDGFDYVYSVHRIVADEQGNDTRDMPHDTAQEPVLLLPISSREIEELERIVHAMPMLLRPPKDT